MITSFFYSSFSYKSNIRDSNINTNKNNCKNSKNSNNRRKIKPLHHALVGLQLIPKNWALLTQARA